MVRASLALPFVPAGMDRKALERIPMRSGLEGSDPIFGKLSISISRALIAQPVSLV
jgi:hypothetical protein